MANYPGQYDFLAGQSAGELKGELMYVRLGDKRVVVEATEAKTLGYSDEKGDECYTVSYKAPKGPEGAVARMLCIGAGDYVSSLHYHEVGQYDLEEELPSHSIAFLSPPADPIIMALTISLLLPSRAPYFFS